MHHFCLSTRLEYTKAIVESCYDGRLTPPANVANALLQAGLRGANLRTARLLWQTYGAFARLRCTPDVQLTEQVLLRVMRDRGRSSLGKDEEEDSVNVEGPHDATGTTKPSNAARVNFQLLNLVLSVVGTYAHDGPSLDRLLPQLQEMLDTLDLFSDSKVLNELRCANALVQARTGKALLGDSVLRAVNQRLVDARGASDDEDYYKHLFCSKFDVENTLAKAAAAVLGEAAVSQVVGDGLLPVDALVTRDDGKQVALLYVPSWCVSVNKPATLLRSPALASQLLDALGVPVVLVHASDWDPLDESERQAMLRGLLETV